METLSVAAYPLDAQYVREQFVEFDALCRSGRRNPADLKRAIADFDMPAPSYVLDDGTWYFPADYFSLETDRTRFFDRMQAAARRYGVECTVAGACDAWVAFIEGAYGACLKHASPENIVLKEVLIERIARLISRPDRDDPQWIAGLRDSVDALDDLERPFAREFDRRRFGKPLSRETYIERVREEFPEIER